MPIHPFNGETFVAFLDISGFKELMKQNDKALKALNRLYQIGFDTISDGAEIEGLFVSDCGILFVRNTDNICSDFKKLMEGIKKINRAMLNDNFTTVSSVAFGQFKYQDKLEIAGIEKNAIYGGAYVDAFLDVEKGEPRIKSGQCRIVKKNLPTELKTYLDSNDDEFSSMFKTSPKDTKHYIYYWNLDNENQIENFEKQYNDSYKLVFQGFLDALKNGRQHLA